MLTRYDFGEKKWGPLGADVKRILVTGGVSERRNIDVARAICDLVDGTS
jgi:RPA family protein